MFYEEDLNYIYVLAMTMVILYMTKHKTLKTHQKADLLLFNASLPIKDLMREISKKKLSQKMVNKVLIFC